VRSTFSLYLENMGIQLVPEQRQGIPELVITLYDCTLNLSNHTWIAAIDYEAEFAYKGNILTRTFRGRAEKVKIFGIKQAHEVMSDISNDMVKKLDVKRLFAETSKKERYLSN
jgi:hypothetical protein